MCEQDLESVLEIELKSQSLAWTENQFRAEFSNVFSKLYVVRSIQDIIAFAIVMYAADELQITNLAVHPDYRKNRVATFLLDTLLSQARMSGTRTAHLEVRSSNSKALNLYKKFGFSLISVRKNYYKAPLEDAYLMSAELT